MTKYFETAQINNRIVECPECSFKFRVKQAPRGAGAQYVKEWDHVPAQLLRIAQVWYAYADMQETPMTKVAAREHLARHAVCLTENAASARISELLGIGAIRVATPEERYNAPDYTDKAPQYILNRCMVTKLLNAGGRL